VIVVAGLTVGENNKHSDSEAKTIISTVLLRSLKIKGALSELQIS